MKLRPKEPNTKTMNIYDFSDKLNSDRVARENFVSEYVDHLKDIMDRDDIITEWAEMMYEKYMSEIKNNGADGIIEDVAYHSPDWLQVQFKVDPSLAQV
jgi:phosphoglucomutase